MEDIVTFDEFVLSSVNLKQVHALILQSSVIPCWRHIAVEKINANKKFQFGERTHLEHRFRFAEVQKQRKRLFPLYNRQLSEFHQMLY